MKSIKLNGYFLDIKPGTSTEIQRKSPLFAINDYSSEVTTEPIVFPYTPGNALAFDLPYQYYSERKKKKYPVEHYSNGAFRGNATLVIETGALDLNNIEATEIRGYLLYGISNFLQDIKGKKLSDLKLGGKRTFNYTTNNPTDGTPGYWQHFHETWTNDTIPYVFYPVRNENYYTADGDVEWMNKLNNDAKLLFELPNSNGTANRSPIIPFIRLRYLLEQIFAESGIEVDFSGLNDTEWQKLTMLNLTKVDWFSPQPVLNSDGHIEVLPRPVPVLTIDLSRHVPQDALISDLIVQLFNRYGWAPLFDGVRNKCRYVAVKEAEKGTVKDWTRYAEPRPSSNFNEDLKVFAFTNEIDANDELPSSPEIKNLTFGRPAAFARYLPKPSIADAGIVRYCYHDNQWWQVQLDETTNEYEWNLLADNIYNDEPDGATDTIGTTISTLPVYDSQYREEGGVTYNGLFPTMKQEARKNIGFRLLLYHGMVNELAWNGTTASYPKQYPFASSTREDPSGTAPLTWSNVYRHVQFGQTTAEKDFGIRAYWWSTFLDILQAGENNEFKLNLPYKELLNFNWDDKILIKNIPYLVVSMIEPDPYAGFVQATLKRIAKPEVMPVVDNTGAVVDGVFAKLTVVKKRSVVQFVSLTMVTSDYSDVTVQLFSDSAGSLPYIPATTVYVYVKKEWINSTNGGTPSYIENKYYAVNAAVEVIIAEVITKIVSDNLSDPQPLGEATFTLDPAGAYGYVVI